MKKYPKKRIKRMRKIRGLIFGLVLILIIVGIFKVTAEETAPTKSASIASENLFLLSYGDGPTEQIQFRYDEIKTQWLVSATCIPNEEAGAPSAEPHDFEGIPTFFEGCDDDDPNTIGVSEIFSGAETLEEGKEALCSYYAKNVVEAESVSFFINGKKILPLTPLVGDHDGELKLTVKNSCLDQIYMAAEGSVTAETEIEEHEDLSEIGEGGQEVTLTEQLSNPQLCEIDSAWIAAGTNLGIANAAKSLVFTLVGWMPFDDACKPKMPVAASSGKKYMWSSQYDSIISQELTPEMKSNGIDLDLVKAIISHESAFQPQAISTAGCVGLMQICYSSVPSATLSYKKTTCCGAGNDSPKQTCTSEVKQTKHLWQAKVYECNPDNDDRFDPNKNIAMGIELFSKKYTQCDNSINGALSAYASGSCNKKLDYAETVLSIKNAQQNK